MALSRVLRFLLWSCGISVVVWVYADPRFRNAEGFLQGTFCLPLTVGVALVLLGWAVTGQLKQFAFWFALALIGQAVALQLVEAGALVRYQHYKPLNRLLTETHPLLLICLSAQTALVVLGLRSRWPKIRLWLGRTFHSWQLLGVGLIFMLTSATVSREMPSYVAEIIFASFVQMVALANIVLMVWALPEETLRSLQQKFTRVFGRPAGEGVEESGGVDRFAVPAAVWVAVLASLLSWFVYENHPHLEDEVGYIYHARYFAEGKLTVPAPPVPKAFSLYLVPYESDRWYSIVPPGWPAMLTMGVIFGIPWLVNPLLSGVNVLLSYAFLREIYPRRTARIAVVLLCLSPWFVFMGMNFMTHTFTLTCALAASLAVAWARKTERSIWGFVGGCAVGMVSLIRPLDGLLVGGLLGLWAIGVGDRRLKVPAILSFVMGAVAVGAIVLPYNQQITGDPTVFPLMDYFEKYFGPKTNALGFGPERGLNWPIDAYPGHSPFEALINAILNASLINVELFGWATGSLLVVALFLFSGRFGRSDYFMLAVAIATVGVFSLYWFGGGPDFGARYWYLMVIPLAALTARGVQFLETTFPGAPAGSLNQSARVMVAVLSLSVIAFVNFFPWRAIDKYYHYLGMRPDIRYLEKKHHFGRSIVLIRGRAHPDYASAWTYNPLDPQADVPVYAWDQNPEIRIQVLNAYPNRPVWILNGPSITHRGFEVVAGPLSARDLMSKEEEKG